MADIQDLWRDLVARYSVVKKLQIRVEEFDPDKNTNAQAYNELKGALDHCMRLMNSELDSEDEKKILSEYAGAKGHLKRAFYDAADYMSMLYRLKIIELLKPYSPIEIKDCLPDYYVAYRPQIEEINNDIAGLRNLKGSEIGSDYDQFETYLDKLDVLENIYTQCIKSEASLIEIHEKNIIEQKKEDSKQRWRMIWTAIIAAIVGGLVVWGITALISALL